MFFYFDSITTDNHVTLYILILLLTFHIFCLCLVVLVQLLVFIEEYTVNLFVLLFSPLLQIN